MPTSTFYNLSKEKKERIIEAIQTELESNDISTLSINKIIKRAGISRGSFYQYFQDKKDMLQYMMEEFFHKMTILTGEKLQKNHGDLFQSFEEIVYDIHEYVLHTDLKEMHCRLLSDRRIHELFFSIARKEKLTAIFYKEMESLVKDEIKRDDFLLLLELLIDVTASTVVEMFQEENYERVFEQEMGKYHNKLMIIKRGCLS